MAKEDLLEFDGIVDEIYLMQCSRLHLKINMKF